MHFAGQKMFMKCTLYFASALLVLHGAVNEILPVNISTLSGHSHCECVCLKKKKRGGVR